MDAPGGGRSTEVECYTRNAHGKCREGGESGPRNRLEKLIGLGAAGRVRTNANESVDSATRRGVAEGGQYLSCARDSGRGMGNEQKKPQHYGRE